jgi:hypothetical protein
MFSACADKVTALLGRKMDQTPAPQLMQLSHSFGHVAPSGLAGNGVFHEDSPPRVGFEDRAASLPRGPRGRRMPGPPPSPRRMRDDGGELSRGGEVPRNG